MNEEQGAAILEGVAIDVGDAIGDIDGDKRFAAIEGE